jgi:hypothetical protein
MGYSGQRHEVLISGAVLLHDKTPPRANTGAIVQLDLFNWELFDCPPYNPDLSPSDCHHRASTKMRKEWRCLNFGGD